MLLVLENEEEVLKKKLNGKYLDYALKNLHL
jgi:protein-S-isoprenylcysteine O-methyltransferase Ste14